MWFAHLIEVSQQDASLEKCGPPGKSEELYVVVTVDGGEHIERKANFFRFPDALLQGLHSPQSVAVILMKAIQMVDREHILPRFYYVTDQRQT